MEGEWGSEEAREMDGLRPGSLAGLLLLCQGEPLERFERTISSLLGCKMGWLLQAFSHIRSFILSCCSYLSKIFFCSILNMLHIWVLRESIFGENICEANCGAQDQLSHLPYTCSALYNCSRAMLHTGRNCSIQPFSSWANPLSPPQHPPPPHQRQPPSPLVGALSVSRVGN